MTGIIGRIIDRLALFAGYVRATEWQKDPASRESLYTINQLMYDGAVYYSRQNGGCLEDILRDYCNVTTTAKGRIIPHFLPVKEIVDFYGFVMPGTWGEEIRPVLQDKTTDPVDDKFLATLTTIWRDSNLNSEKSRITKLASLFGTVGLRVPRIAGASEDGSGDKVIIQPDEPSRIFNPEEDAAGNCVSVVLKYKIPVNRGTSVDPEWEDAEVVEIINKDEFSRKINGKEQVPKDDRRNTFGFCPYVLLRHEDNGTIWGDYAFKGSESQIHNINWRITRQGTSIDRTQFSNWFFTAGGPKPVEIDLGDGQKAQYTQTAQGTPPPSAEAIVPKIDQASATNYVLELMAMMRSRQPELIFNDVKLLSGLSGESIAQILTPAKKAILDVRPNYDHAFIRALQMATSIRADLGLSDMGSNGDELYKSGKLAFAFAKRDPLPQTDYQRQAQAAADNAPRAAKFANAKALQGIGGDDRSLLEEAGYTEEQIDKMLGAKASDDVTRNNEL